jgi:hypothetical protein
VPFAARLHSTRTGAEQGGGEKAARGAVHCEGLSKQIQVKLAASDPRCHARRAHGNAGQLSQMERPSNSSVLKLGY